MEKAEELFTNIIDYMQSREFHEAGLLSRKRVVKQLNKKQRLCQNIHIFEKEFYERTNISLLKVENERLAKEKMENKEQTI